jgi:hypothetical protein
MMDKAGISHGSNIGKSENKYNYVNSALSKLSTDEIQDVSFKIISTLSDNERVSEDVKVLKTTMDSFADYIKSRQKEVITAVRANSIRRAVCNVFSSIDKDASPDCGSVYDVARRHGIYEHDQWKEENWSIMSHISSELLSIPDERLIDLSKAVIEDLKDSFTTRNSLLALESELGFSPTRLDRIYVVFATDKKPDIVIKDLIKGQIDIKDGGGGLIFHDYLGRESLSWGRLINWFEHNYFDRMLGSTPQNQLRDRLLDAVSKDSPAEQAFFRTYWDYTIQDYDMVALLPQVWLQYDARTASQRGGTSAFKHQRMDFMLLLKNNRSLIIEIDGRDHYARVLNPRPAEYKYDIYVADPDRYADMMAEDRAMKFAGYEVLRYGAKKISASTIKSEIQQLIEFIK